MKILFSKTSLNYLEKLTPKNRKRIFDAISKLPDHGDVKKMRGRKINNIFRSRVGKFRILFLLESEEKRVKILSIDPRGDIYK